MSFFQFWIPLGAITLDDDAVVPQFEFQRLKHVKTIGLRPL
jgi:hypothetical protein